MSIFPGGSQLVSALPGMGDQVHVAVVLVDEFIEDVQKLLLPLVVVRGYSALEKRIYDELLDTIASVCVRKASNSRSVLTVTTRSKIQSFPSSQSSVAVTSPFSVVPYKWPA